MPPRTTRIVFCPDLRGIIQRVLDDGAADDETLKAAVQEQWGVQLLVSINPRSRRPIRDVLPRGVDHITPTGTPRRWWRSRAKK